VTFSQVVRHQDAPGKQQVPSTGRVDPKRSRNRLFFQRLQEAPGLTKPANCTQL
jgi:hypothetical protein